MHSYLKLALINCILASLLADKSPSVLGVAEDRLHLYVPKAENKFQCFDDSSKVFDFSVVNDDYCDCEDGSDEPGTSACPNSYFFCKNDGYKSHYIYSSRVGDGVCDCCDGSDEYEGKIKCPNNCSELAASERAEEERRFKIFTEGSKIRQTYIHQYASIKDKALKEVESLKKKIEDAKYKVEELRKIKEEKEAKETEETANKSTEESGLDSSKNDIINKFEDLKEVASSLQEDIKHLQSVLDDLKQNHNQNYHDMAVKGAITAYDEFTENFNEIDFHSDPRFTVEKVEESVTQEISEGEMNFDKSTLESTLETKPLQWIWDNVSKLRLRVFNYASNLLTRAPIDVSQARNQLWDAESSLRDLESDLEKASQSVDMDYGPDGSFAALKDKCFEVVQGEYTYSVCMFGEAHQKSNRGDNISLGRFSKWDGENNSQQLYSEGAYCWNGPQRSARIFIECGVEEKIFDVSEPEKCVYHMRMITPAACFAPRPSQNTAREENDLDEKDEL